MTPRSLYKEVVSIIQEYLGPAAERFVDRIIDFHLHKKPQDLKPSDIPKLSEWVKVSLGLLTEEHELVDECQRRLLLLSQTKAKRAT
jgi:hypothetical protein